MLTGADRNEAARVCGVPARQVSRAALDYDGGQIIYRVQGKSGEVCAAVPGLPGRIVFDPRYRREAAYRYRRDADREIEPDTSHAGHWDKFPEGIDLNEVFFRR
jgi:hypothetical protein